MSSYVSVVFPRTHDYCQPQCRVIVCADWSVCRQYAVRTRLSRRAFQGETWS